LKHVLIVEDDPDVLDACVGVLSDEGYEVSMARNGREALELLRTGPHPVVILLDLMMPVMNGFEFRARQLADPSIAGLPVVVVTAGAASNRVRELRPLAYLTKPFELNDLLRVVESTHGGRGIQGPR
jgi:CheY-like chemotaxis protein